MESAALNDNFIAVMTQRCRYIPGAIVEHANGIVTAFSQRRPASGYCVLSSPVTSSDDFERRVRAALSQGERSTAPWHLAILSDWFVATAHEAVLDANGLRRVARAYGMCATRLAEPRRPLPAMEVRRARTRDDLADLVRLNNDAYGVTPATEGDVYLHYGLAPRSCAMVGYVDGEPVTAAAAFPTEQGCYLGAVATAEHWRRRGFGEAICREVLTVATAETGLSSAVLLASPGREGYYEPLGFTIGAEWLLYRVVV